MRWVLAILGVIGLVAFLRWQFPYAAQSTAEQMNIVYLVGLLALVGSGFLHSREFSGSYIIKTSLIWLAVFAVLIIGYSYRNVFMNNRLMAELVPHRAQVSSDGTITVRSDESGHFNIEVDVNGTPVKFLIDTGATDIVLSPRDAKRSGFDIGRLNYNRRYATANGTVKGASVRIGKLQIGRLVMRDVPASVNGAEMGSSLLGMRFLNRMRSYSVQGNVLTLVP